MDCVRGLSGACAAFVDQSVVALVAVVSSCSGVVSGRFFWSGINYRLKLV